MKRAVILGGSGYTGLELLRILLHHPEVEVAAVTSERQAGRLVAEAFPWFSGAAPENLRYEALGPPVLGREADLFFSALPHGTAMDTVASLMASGKRVVDLSADFRLREPERYSKWYTEHKAPTLLKEAVYGLAEFHRDRIAGARLVANPGCYATGALLALLPLVEEGLIDPESIVVDSKSGVSGAGRTLREDLLFAETNESVRPYNIAKHRHTPEIEQELGELVGREVGITFTPHLVPMSRGILTTAYATAKRDICDPLEPFRRRYAREPFVRILPQESPPATAEVRGSNVCALTAVIDHRNRRWVVISALDNLVKGAAGQAVQNANLMLGIPETAALGDLSPVR